MSNNPFVANPVIGKIKTKLGGKKKNSETETIGLGSVRAYLIGMNNAFPICAEASACCWDKPVPETYDKIADYVGRRSKTGHTSILEHSNFVIYLEVDNSFTDDLLKFCNTIKYLNTFIEKSNDGSYWHVLIGGSYRGYSDLYRETNDLNGIILQNITSILYTYSNVGAFEDICELGLLNRQMFTNTEPDENFKLLTTEFENDEVDFDLFKVLGLDSMKKLYGNLREINEEAAKKVSVFDMMKFATITVLFKNMSRTCTHQLVRHRNAITQESQRYVNYSESCFSSPAVFKPDKYDPNHKYAIRFASSGMMYLTLDDIGEAICNIYGQLQNAAITGNNYQLLKEDARAFLPGNVQCRKIYMTFTLKSFVKFLNLREDKHAQAEIRMYATAVGDWFRNNSEFKTKELCDLYTKPRLLIEDPFNFDENLGITEEVFTVSDEEYEQANGLESTEDDVAFESIKPNKDNEV